MARQPHLYGALREDHRRTLDSLNKHIEQHRQPEPAAQVEAGRESPGLDGGGTGRDGPPEVTTAEPEGPERPSGHYGRSSGWTDQGGMVEQQASAMAMVRDHHERRMALLAHMDQQRGDTGPDVSGGTREQEIDARALPDTAPVERPSGPAQELPSEPEPERPSGPAQELPSEPEAKPSQEIEPKKEPDRGDGLEL